MDAIVITGLVGIAGIAGSVGAAIFGQWYTRGTTLAGATKQITAAAEVERQRDMRALRDLRVARLRAAYEEALQWWFTEQVVRPGPEDLDATTRQLAALFALVALEPDTAVGDSGSARVREAVAEAVQRHKAVLKDAQRGGAQQATTVSAEKMQAFSDAFSKLGSAIQEHLQELERPI